MEPIKSPRKRRRLILVVTIGIGLPIVLILYLLIYNNVSLQSQKGFTKDLDSATSKAMLWAIDNERNLLGSTGFINTALLRMLHDCNGLRHTPAFDRMIEHYMACAVKYEFRKAELDPDWPIDEVQINEAFNEESEIDYKWMIYALAPEKIDVHPEALDFFNPDSWQGRKLTHQLWALELYRERNESGKDIDELIEHLCDRLASQLNTDIHVVDIYIQKVAFILKAGHPEKIKRRWIECIIDNQNPDGGWDDRWFCFTSDRRPQFGRTQSNQHASIQALWVLYQTKYRYPEVFGVQSTLK